MPKIATYQPNQIGPVQTTGARFQAANNNGGIGGAMARGLGSLGEGLANFAETKDRIDAIADDRESREGALRLQQDATDVLAEAQASAGMDARTASSKAMERLKTLQSGLVGQATSPRAARLLQERTDPILTGYQTQLAEHTARQVKVAAMGTAQAEADHARDEAVQFAMSDVARSDAALAAGREAIVRKSYLAGRSEIEANQDAHGFESSARRATFDSFVADGQWDHAIEYERAHRDRFSADDANAMASTVRGVVERRQAAGDAAAAIGVGAPASQFRPSGQFSMPVPGGRVTSGFGAAREGARHNGVDFAVPEGTAITPIASGTVVSVSSDPRSGRFVVVDHGNGLTSSYSHMGNQSVKEGDTVTGSSHLGTVGMTGHTTGPHVHVVTRRNGAPIDPMSIIGTNAPAGQSAPSWDKRAAYDHIDAQQEWSFERRQAAKDEIDRTFARKDALDAREEREADEQALTIVTRLGDGFTSVNQLPQALRDQLSPDAMARYIHAADANTQPQANGPTAAALNVIRFNTPETFETENLAKYQGQVTRAEMDTLLTQQAQMRAETRQKAATAQAQSKAWSPRAGIVTAVSYGQDVGGLKLNDQDKSAVMQIMEAEAWAQFKNNGQKPLTDHDYEVLFRSATRNARLHSPVWGDSQTPRYRLTESQIPDAARAEILKRYEREWPGHIPTDAEILRGYRAMNKR